MQPYTAFPAAITLPFAALYMAFYDTKQTKNATSGSKSSSNCSRRLNVIGPGQDIRAKLTEIDIPGKNQSKIINLLDSLNWITRENPSCSSGILDVYNNFLDDIPGNSLNLLINLAFLLAFQMIMRYSILGIFSKIIWKRLVRTFWYVFSYVASMKNVLVGDTDGTGRSQTKMKETEAGTKNEESESATKSLQEIYGTLVNEDRDELAECTHESIGVDDDAKSIMLKKKLSEMRVQSEAEGLSSSAKPTNNQNDTLECVPGDNDCLNVPASLMMDSSLDLIQFRRHVDVTLVEEENGFTMENESGDECCVTNSQTLIF